MTEQEREVAAELWRRLQADPDPAARLHEMLATTRTLALEWALHAIETAPGS